MITEYLVNFDYLNRLMEDFGFKIISREEAKQLGLPEGNGLFSELYMIMLEEIKKNKYSGMGSEYGEANNMSSYEKKISFLNRYFVYKKIRHINTNKVLIDDDDDDDDDVEIKELEKKVVKESGPKSNLKPSIEIKETIIEEIKPKKPITSKPIQKLKQKLVIEN